MKPSNALDLHRQAVRETVARYPMRNPRVFGSVAHGSDREGSDLDILVDALPGTTLLDMGGLYEELIELLGVPVDLRTPQGISPRYRDRVLSEAIPL
jgi:uncharacterized protein